MSFSADWLALRLAADLRARDDGLAARLAAHFAGHTGGRGHTGDKGLRIVDLGAGSGNNMIATAAWLPKGQTWCLVDHDQALLDAAPRPEDVAVETRQLDMARDIEALFEPLPDLVTASAFFDLCGSVWLARFADGLAATGAAFYTVLSYDGREVWEPPHPLDAQALAAFHADQCRDKGFGPSLGPGAHDHLAGLLRDRGYRVAEASSDWVLSSAEDAALIATLAEGSAAAIAPALGMAAESWRDARRQARQVRIGHKDLLALPPA